MILYTCGQKKSLPTWSHPCSRAARALDDAGYEYELEDLPGYRMAPWTWGERRRGREKIRALTGQINLPVLVLDEGETVIGSAGSSSGRRPTRPTSPRWAEAKRGAGSISSRC